MKNKIIKREVDFHDIALRYLYRVGDELSFSICFPHSSDVLVTFPDKSRVHVCILYDGVSFDVFKLALKRLDRMVTDTMLIHSMERTEDIEAFSQFSVTVVNHQRIAEWIELSRRIPDYRHIHLHAHNENALMDYRSRDLSHDSFLQATGTGKSYLIAAIAQHVYPERVAIVSSSHYIIEQQKKIIGSGIDACYLTYNYLAVSTENAVREAKGCSVVVLDEFHRAGAENWEKGVGKLNEAVRPKKVIGTTATHIRHLDAARDMSMELFEGNVCQYLPLTNAIAKGILRSPRYVSGVYSIDESISEYTRKVKSSKIPSVVKDELLDRINETRIDWYSVRGVKEIFASHIKSYDERFLMFCQDSEHLTEMRVLLLKWLKEVTDKPIYIHALSHKKGKAKNDETMKAFSSSPLGEIHVLATINMLNEGKHIKEVDGAFLFRKTLSQNLFYQQIGRVFDAGSYNNPLIFDLVGNVSNIHKSLFGNDLYDQQSRVNKHRLDMDMEAVNYGGYIKDHSHGTLSKLKEIDAMIGSSILSNEDRVDAIEQYFNEHGTAFIKQGAVFGDIDISSYANRLRKDYRAGRLDERIASRLERIGFVFNYADSLSLHCINALKKHKDEHGNKPLPDDWHEQGVRIKTWLSQERKKYREGVMCDKVKRSLLDLGISLEPLKDAESEYIDALVNFVSKYGHANVPYNYEAGKCALGAWCVKARQDYSKGIMNEERKKVLYQLGFIFSKKDFEFNERYLLLKAYYEKNGNLKLPFGYKEGGINLYNYLRGIRQRIKDGSSKLTNKQKEMLVGIGFQSGKAIEGRDKVLSKLEDYVKENGSLARLSVVDEALSEKLYRLRKAGKNGKLSKLQKSRLEKLKY